MISNRYVTLLKAVLLLTMLCFGCAETPVTGSETTSGVEIAVIETTIHGKTSAGAIAHIFTTDYSADDLQPKYTDSAIADDTGGFTFFDLPYADYNIYVYPDGIKNSGVTLQNIPVIQIDHHQDTFTDSAAFATLRTITGTVTQNLQPLVDTRVTITGSPFSITTDSEGKYTFTAIPEGKYTVIVKPVRSWNTPGDSSIVDLRMSDTPVTTVDFNFGN